MLFLFFRKKQSVNRLFQDFKPHFDGGGFFKPQMMNNEIIGGNAPFAFLGEPTNLSIILDV